MHIQQPLIFPAPKTPDEGDSFRELGSPTTKILNACAYDPEAFKAGFAAAQVYRMLDAAVHLAVAEVQFTVHKSFLDVMRVIAEDWDYALEAHRSSAGVEYVFVVLRDDFTAQEA